MQFILLCQTRPHNTNTTPVPSFLGTTRWVFQRIEALPGSWPLQFWSQSQRNIPWLDVSCV